MAERRSGKRYECILFVRFGDRGQGEWAAISRNASQSGLLMAVGKRVEVGEELTLTFRVAPDTEEREIKGTVIRIEENAEGPQSYWPHRVAVEFVEPMTDMMPILEQLPGVCSDDNSKEV